MRTGQSRRGSIIEVCLSTAIGYVVAVSTQMMLFPLVGIHTSTTANLEIGATMTVVSVVRSFWVRRLFNYLHVKGILA